MSAGVQEMTAAEKKKAKKKAREKAKKAGDAEGADTAAPAAKKGGRKVSLSLTLRHRVIRLLQYLTCCLLEWLHPFESADVVPYVYQCTLGLHTASPGKAT